MYLVYFFLTLCTGVVSLGIMAFLYTRTKERLVRSYLYFYSTFTLFVLVDMLFTYLRLNLALSPETLSILQAVLAVTGLIWIFAIVVFTHTLFQEFPGKQLSKKFLLLFGFGFPGLFVDMLLLEKVTNFRLFPLFYCGISVMLTHHFLKYVTYPAQIRPFHGAPKGSSTGIDDTALFEQHAISPREQDIVHLIIQGYSNKQIAENLSITVSTVKKHITSVYQKMEIKSRYELIARFKNIECS